MQHSGAKRREVMLANPVQVVFGGSAVVSAWADPGRVDGFESPWSRGAVSDSGRSGASDGDDGVSTRTKEMVLMWGTTLRLWPNSGFK